MSEDLVYIDADDKKKHQMMESRVNILDKNSTQALTPTNISPSSPISPSFPAEAGAGFEA